MTAIQDPNFWKRFSMAVHQDDAERGQVGHRPNLKHSYVLPLPASAHHPAEKDQKLEPHKQRNPSRGRDSSQGSREHKSPSTLTISVDTAVTVSEPLSPAALPERATLPGRPPATPDSPSMVRPKRLRKSTSQTSRAASSTRPQSKPTSDAPTKSPYPIINGPKRSSTHSHRSFTTLVLGQHSSNNGISPPHHKGDPLPSRPPSRLKFWTAISADPSNRDSWLERQQRKKKQRLWMCWLFWGGLVIVAASVVVVVVVLRWKRILR